MSDLILRATADVSGALAGLDKVKAKIGEVQGTAARAGGGAAGGGMLGGMLGGVAGGVAGVLSIGAVGGLIKDSVAEANRFDVSMARVAMSLERAGKASEVARVRRFAGMMEETTGIDDAEVAAHMARVIVAGETDIANAAAKVRLALDIQSAGFGDAAGTIDAMTKAGADQEMMLKRLAAKLGIAAADGMTLNEVMAAMQEKVRGASERMHDATKGTEAMRVAWDNLKQAMGENFLAMYGKGGVVRTALGMDKPEDSGRLGFRKRMSQGEDGSGFVDDGETGYTPLEQYRRGWINRRQYMSIITGEYNSFARQEAADVSGRGAPVVSGRIGKDNGGGGVAGGVARVEISVRADSRAPTQAAVRGI